MDAGARRKVKNQDAHIGCRVCDPGKNDGSLPPNSVFYIK